MRLVVVADTHLRPGRHRQLPVSVIRAMGEADLVLHAGDITAPESLAQMQAVAPVRAVLGNNDHDLVHQLPSRLELDLEGVRLGMVHDSGPAPGRPGRLRRWFPGCDLVIFGHSHIPWRSEGVGGQLLFNPGSPTDKRAQPNFTMGRVDLAQGQIRSAEIVVL